MAIHTCPEGHRSATADWCDVCGAPIAIDAPPAAPVPVPPAPAAASIRTCPHCRSEGPGDALFCEVCGYDFTTGEPPPPPAPAPPAGGLVVEVSPPAPSGPVTAVAEVWVDPDWYADQDADEPCPSAGAPVVVPLHEPSVLIGRTSVSRSIHPQIDCLADTGVSRRHAQLTTDGQRWWVEDLRSANGTYLGSAGGPLPAEPIPPGERRELSGGDRLYLGAWTRIVVRAPTAAEQQA